MIAIGIYYISRTAKSKTIAIMRLLFLGISIFFSYGIQAQTIPKVFIIEEEVNLFEQLSDDDKYKTLLLEACNNDINVTDRKLTAMLMEMQAYAGRLSYDIKGVKVWFKFFWNKKGGIDHIAFNLKPTSRNIDTEIFTIFLSRFIQGYGRMVKIRYQTGFSHYGAFSFPIR